MTEDKTIVFYTFNSMEEAILAQEKLSENGIDSFLQNENVFEAQRGTVHNNGYKTYAVL